MSSFGLVAEGPTDHWVLKNILFGYFGDPDLEIHPLQPLLDATDASQAHGGWNKVLDYIESDVFTSAFDRNDFIVIQIDTDHLHEAPFNLNRQNSDGKEAPPSEIVERVVEKLRQIMDNRLGDGFSSRMESRIIYAISVEEIECWLLPLLYTDRNKSRTRNCLYKLNEKLARNGQQTINPGHKAPNQYRDISKSFSRSKELIRHRHDNPSLSIFLSEIEVKTGIPLTT